MRRPAKSRSGVREAGAPSSYQTMKKNLEKELKKEKRNRRRDEQKNVSLQKELQKAQREKEHALQENSRLKHILEVERESFLDEVHVAVRHRLAEMGHGSQQ